MASLLRQAHELIQEHKSADASYLDLLGSEHLFDGHRLRWGFLATGKIANDFATVVQTLKDQQLYACAAHELDRAKDFQQRFKFEKAYGSYEQLVQDSDVDVVYISTLHVDHFKCTKLALNAGKHVLCEKPLCVTAEQVQELITLSRSKQKLLVEAMWTRFQPPIRKVRQLLDDKAIGDVRLVTADMFFIAASDKALADRLYDPEKAGGAILDIGIYGISLASMVYGGQPPTATGVLTELSETRVDEQDVITLKYGKHQLATVTCGITYKSHGDAMICGEKGYIKICGPGFHHSEKILLVADGQAPKEFHFPKPKIKGDWEFMNGELMVFEAKEIGRLLSSAQTESDLMPLSETLHIARTMDKLRAQAGIEYPFEETAGNIKMGQ